METITLYYREGSSDKVYQATLEPKDGGFVVHFAYGRRGSTLQTGTKTQSPVEYAAAKAIYDKLIREKTSKGYTPGECGTPYQQSGKETQVSGIIPQLLNAITLEEATSLITHPLWAVQEKFDGKRLLVRKTDQGIDGINRNGLFTALPQPIVEAAVSIPGTFLFDGECIGDTLHVFDALELRGADCRSLPYRERLNTLMRSVPVHGQHLIAVETALESAHKAELFARLKKENKEGVVFKNMAAPHSSGRPASGGDALKFKFCETASFIVAKVNAKRSVSLLLFDGDKIKPAGNVTVPPNHPLPAPGAVVECRFLYAFPESGCIYQPVYLGVRDDIRSEECTTGQLKFKATAELRAA